MPSPQTSPSLARRVVDLKPSATIAVTNRAKDLIRQGVDVLSFAAGEPDFDTPDIIKDAAIRALKAGQTKYMPTMGDPETRGVIADKVAHDNNLPGVTPDHVGISSGGKHALYTICQCLFDFPAPNQPPQECLIPVPAWVSYMPLAELAGGKVVEIPTTVDTDFKMSPEQLKKAITPRSRMLVLNSPSNPCGTMYTEQELRAIAAVVAEAAATIAPDLVILSDEIYEKVAYGGIPHFSIGSFPEVAERTITLNGLSKAYSMTGWRIGYTTTSGPWGLKFMKAMATLQGQMTTNITSFLYPAIRTALNECEGDAQRMCAEFAKRAELIYSRMKKMPNLGVAKPTGAFYVFPDVSDHFGKSSSKGKPINSALDFCEALLAEALVAAVPGEDFGGCGKNHVRFSFACSEAQINKGMDRLEAFLASLK
ncbi:MAG: pyridoxal phosphate-dependent aminotransferase [Phycisphaerales bacterium]|nr:pyridoxal phosphate-dependent aminotransferase [Phycisphaerales bacterium]